MFVLKAYKMPDCLSVEQNRNMQFDTNESDDSLNLTIVPFNPVTEKLVKYEP